MWHLLNACHVNTFRNYYLYSFLRLILQINTIPFFTSRTSPLLRSSLGTSNWYHGLHCPREFARGQAGFKRCCGLVLKVWTFKKRMGTRLMHWMPVTYTSGYSFPPDTWSSRHLITTLFLSKVQSENKQNLGDDSHNAFHNRFTIRRYICLQRRLYKRALHRYYFFFLL